MRVLVTGGQGFVGSHVCDRLKVHGHEPVILDRRAMRATFLPDPDTRGDKLPESSLLFERDCDTILGDVRDLTAVMEAVASVDGVIHLAAVLGTQETIDEPWPAAETNILGSLNVFKAIRHYRQRAVYITVGNHWMNNPYSITKTAAERFALMANKEWGTEIAIVRALNAYGPRQKALPVRKIMPNFILPALADEVITLYGDGEQVMDMIYVTDVAEILVRALLFSHRSYDRVFEAGTGRPTTVNEIAAEVIRQAGGGRINRVPMRPGETPGSVVVGDPSTLAPLELAADDLVTLEDGVTRTIDYYR